MKIDMTYFATSKTVHICLLYCGENFLATSLSDLWYIC